MLWGLKLQKQNLLQILLIEENKKSLKSWK